MEERLVTLHNDIDEAFETYALCAGRNAFKHTELRNHLAWLLGDNLLEGAFDYDADDYQDDYEDTWDDETTWGKGSTTTPTTATSGVQLITTPPQLVTTPPHVFRFGSPAPPEAIHVDAGKSAMTLNYPADECADSTADDRALAERRARGSGVQLITTPPQLITTDVNTLPVALAKRFQVETSALRWVRADAAKLRKAAVLPGHEMSIAEGEEQHAFEAEFDKLQGGLLLARAARRRGRGRRVPARLRAEPRDVRAALRPRQHGAQGRPRRAQRRWCDWRQELEAAQIRRDDEQGRQQDRQDDAARPQGEV